MGQPRETKGTYSSLGQPLCNINPYSEGVPFLPYHLTGWIWLTSKALGNKTSTKARLEPTTGPLIHIQTSGERETTEWSWLPGTSQLWVSLFLNFILWLSQKILHLRVKQKEKWGKEWNLTFTRDISLENTTRKKRGNFFGIYVKITRSMLTFFQWNGQFANDKNAVFILCI